MYIQLEWILQSILHCYNIGAALPHPEVLTEGVAAFVACTGKADMNKDWLAKWWEVKDSILDRNVTAEYKNKLSQLPKSPTEQSYDTMYCYRVYGIYLFPTLINAIAESNSDYAFLSFIELGPHAVYLEAGPARETITAIHNVNKKFPTKESRLKVVNDWWQEHEQEYREVFPKLHDAIAAEIKPMNAESKKTSP